MEQIECMCLVNDKKMGSFTNRSICSQAHYSHVYCLQAYYEAIFSDQDYEITQNKVLKCPFGRNEHFIDLNYVCSVFNEIQRNDLESHLLFFASSK